MSKIVITEPSFTRKAWSSGETEPSSDAQLDLAQRSNTELDALMESGEWAFRF